MKAEQYQCKCPDVVAGQWPSAEEPIQQRVTFDTPRRKLFGPAMRPFDLDLKLGKDKGGDQYEEREEQKVRQCLS